jgi:hypothetical protein
MHSIESRQRPLIAKTSTKTAISAASHFKLFTNLSSLAASGATASALLTIDGVPGDRSRRGRVF